jgi:DNA-binding response OmpR family regulator
MAILQKAEHWRRSYAAVQSAAISETCERLISESDDAILEIIDLAFADLVASYQRDAKLDGAMDLVALDPSLLGMDTELTERLRQSMLDQTRLLMMLSAAGKAADSRGLIDEISDLSLATAPDDLNC